MTFHLLYLPLCVLFSLSLIYSLPNDVQQASFYKMERKSFNGGVVERRLTQDYWDCLFLCVNSVNKNCFSFSFDDAQDQGLHECELCNSEKKLEPEKIQDKEGVTYYGMSEESLYRYLPCASSPCNQRKDCITGPSDGLYSCRCPLKDIGMKFTDDDNCTVDMQQIYKGTMKEEVALTHFSGRTLNFYEAGKLCKLFNASMASYDQLHAAWKANLNVCVNGWINDSRVAFPMQKATAGCGNRVGIIATPSQDKHNRYRVWCFYD